MVDVCFVASFHRPGRFSRARARAVLVRFRWISEPQRDGADDAVAVENKRARERGRPGLAVLRGERELDAVLDNDTDWEYGEFDTSDGDDDGRADEGVR